MEFQSPYFKFLKNCFTSRQCRNCSYQSNRNFAHFYSMRWLNWIDKCTQYKFSLFQRTNTKLWIIGTVVHQSKTRITANDWVIHWLMIISSNSCIFICWQQLTAPLCLCSNNILSIHFIIAFTFSASYTYNTKKTIMTKLQAGNITENLDKF